MCTVSFIPKGKTYIITSNRDEHNSRPISFAPAKKVINGHALIYPKDPQAGGTWFAINENGAVGVLLNGAFAKHISTGNYRISRGLIVLDIVSQEQPCSYLNSINLDNIEPFTFILFQNNQLLELRWDGNKKHIQKLDVLKSYIWSSPTLYTKEVIKQRENLFQEFLEKNTEKETADILNFHSNNYGDAENGFVMKRTSGLKTFSITQAIVTKDEITMGHLDIVNDKQHNTALPLKSLLNQVE